MIRPRCGRQQLRRRRGTARVAVAALDAEPAANAALQRTVHEYRTVVEKARRMSGCKSVNYTFAVHSETPTIGVTLEVSRFDFRKYVACRNLWSLALYAPGRGRSAVG